MKRGIYTLIAALLIGAAGFYVMRQQCGCTHSEKSATHDGGSLLPELEWLHHELKLTSDQFAKVSELHVAYRPVCESLCMKVAASRNRVKALVEAGSITSPELEAALQEQATVQVECQKAMLKHLHQTAASMSPEQARQYLDAMLPQIIGSAAGH